MLRITVKPTKTEDLYIVCVRSDLGHGQSQEFAKKAFGLNSAMESAKQACKSFGVEQFDLNGTHVKVGS